MKLLFSLVICFACIRANAQMDSTILMCKITADVPFYKVPNITSTHKLTDGEYVWAVDKAKDHYIKIVKDTLVGYVNFSSTSLMEEDYQKLNSNNLENKISWAKSLRKDLINELRKDVNEIVVRAEKINAKINAAEKRMKANGFGITNFDVTGNDYSTGFDITAINYASKTIKYLWVTTVAFNPVDDVEGSKTVTCVGPIESGEESTFSFDNLYYSRVIETLRITKIEIQYMDGTRKRITGPTIRSIIL